MRPTDTDCICVCSCVKGVSDHGMMKVVCCRDEGDLALEAEDEVGGEFQRSGLKPTEDRFMRLDDMERFVRAAEQQDMDDDEDADEQTGDDSGDDQTLTICRHMHGRGAMHNLSRGTMASSLRSHVILCCVCSMENMQLTDCVVQMMIGIVSMAAGAGLGRQRWTARMRQPWMNC